MVLTPFIEEAKKVEEMCEVKEIGGMTNEHESSLEEEFHSLSLEESMQPFTMEISHEKSKDQETQDMETFIDISSTFVKMQLI